MTDIISEEWMDEHPFSLEMVAQSGVRLWHKLRDTPKLRLGIYYEQGEADARPQETKVLCAFRTGGEDLDWHHQIKRIVSGKHKRYEADGTIR